MSRRWVLHTQAGDEFYASFEAAQARWRGYRLRGYFSSRPLEVDLPLGSG